MYACVGLIAQAVASLPAAISEERRDDTRRGASSHDAYLILHDQPNPLMTAIVF